MFRRLLPLMLTGTILSVSIASFADIGISPSLSPSEYSKSFEKYDKDTHKYVPASNFAESDLIYLSIKSLAIGSESDGDNIIDVPLDHEGNTAFSVIFSNAGNLSTHKTPGSDTQDGHIFYMDTRPYPYINLSGSQVLNLASGVMTTEGSGYAVYANPLENQRMTTVVGNAGIMDRINMYQTDSSQVANGQTGSGSFVRTAQLNGSVLVGPNAYVYNYGIMQNKADDFNKDFINTPFVSNAIWMDRRTELQNGLAAYVVTSTNEVIVNRFDPGATIATDNIYFKQTGELYNVGIINNKYIGSGDSIEYAQENPEVTLLRTSVRFINDPFYEASASFNHYLLGDHLSYNIWAGGPGYVSSRHDGSFTAYRHTFMYVTDKVMAANTRADLTTDVFNTGDYAHFITDMGSKVQINDNLTLGESAEVEFGRKYFLPHEATFENSEDGQVGHLDASVTVLIEKLEQQTDESGGIVIKKVYEKEDRTLNEIPHRSDIYVKNLTLGNESLLTLSNMTDYEGENITLGDKNELSITGGSLNLSGYASDKIKNNLEYWLDTRTGKDNDLQIYSRRLPSFVNYGNGEPYGGYAGYLKLPDGTYFMYNDGQDPPWSMDYGNNYLGYIKDYINWANGLTAPSSLADFDKFQDSTLTMGANASLSLNTYRRDTINLSDNEVKLEDDATIDDQRHIYSVLPENEEEESILMAKTLSMEQTNNSLEFNGAIVAIKDIKLGDKSTLETAGSTQNAIFADTITFGNYGRYETGEDFKKIVDSTGDKDPIKRTVANTYTVLSGNMTFGDDGHFENKSVFKAAKLIMGDRADVEVADDLWVETWLGSDSVVNILPMEEKGALNGISNGLYKRTGATNVNVYSDAGNLNEPEDKRKIYNENYLLNGVDVSNIYVKSGGLIVGTTEPDSAKGDIHGNVWLNSETWLHVIGNNVRIYDPIARNGGATNTLVWFELDDAAYYDTLNTIDSDKLLVSGGVVNVHHTITAPLVMLDASGAIRVYDNLFLTADIVEYEGSGANTTVFLTPRFEYIDSFGIMSLDRLVVENGTFNTYHKILARGDNDGRPEGIWLGSNATINVHSDVHTSRLIRREDSTVPVVNTTATVDKGLLTVDNSVDIDTLILSSGAFEFRNSGEQLATPDLRNAYITNNIFVSKPAIFWANGTTNPNSGHVIINSGAGTLSASGRVGISPTKLPATGTPGIMHLDADLVMNSGSILDLRTNGTTSDYIHSSNTALLADDIRLFVRNVKDYTSYLLMTADGGLNLPSSFALSFLWHDTTITTPDNINLWLNIGYTTTLKYELEHGNVSDNILKVGGYLSDTWDGSYGPWDDIFFATSLDNAVKVISEYVPEGYINSPQTALRTSATFQNVMVGELNDMRQLAVQPKRSRNTPYRRSSYYSGRSGGDMYQPYVRSRQHGSYASYSSKSNRQSWRTDKGGMWAKPFYVTMTQKKDKGISGYDYDAYGLAAGFDKNFGRLTLGLSGLYSVGDYKTDNDVIEADVSTWGVGLYGSYRPAHSAFFMDFFASYSSNSNEAKHRIKSADAQLKADYDVTSLGAGAALGYDIALAQSFYITPKVGVNYTQLSSDDVEEKGTAPMVVRVETPKINSIQVPAEVKFSFPIDARSFELLPELHARYTHDFGDTDYQSKVYINGSNTMLKLDNVGMPENLFTLGGSLSFTAGPHEFSGRYDYEFGDGLTSHLFNLGYKYLF